jgi:hypothetical protein
MRATTPEKVAGTFSGKVPATFFRALPGGRFDHGVRHFTTLPGELNGFSSDRMAPFMLDWPTLGGHLRVGAS